MKKLRVFFVFLFVLLSFVPVQANAKTHHAHKGHVTRVQRAGVDRAAAYADIVIDAETGRVVHESNGSSLRHPASLTKMMTLYVTFQALESGHLNLGQYLSVSENASVQSPSKLGLRAGQKIRVEDAILGLVTESANDAAVVIAENLGGSEEAFAQLMTRQARALGMSRTVFQNPSGLPDPDQVTTAHDMAVLGSALINHYPQYYSYFDHETFTYAGVVHRNHNHLKERYDGMDGIKTGYIRASGFNLVASAKRSGVRLIGVVFGGRSAVARDNQMARLLDQSFATVVAENRAGGGRMAAATGEGDSNDAGPDDYIALPAKIAAVFPARGAILAPQPQPQQIQQAAVRPEPSVSPRAAPARKPESLNDQAWGVQIGAYSDAAIGRQALANLVATMPNMVDGADPQVQQISAGGVNMYRARMMGVDKKTAQTICSYLIQRGKSCLTVGP